MRKKKVFCLSRDVIPLLLLLASLQLITLIECSSRQDLKNSPPSSTTTISSTSPESSSSRKQRHTVPSSTSPSSTTKKSSKRIKDHYLDLDYGQSAYEPFIVDPDPFRCRGCEADILRITPKHNKLSTSSDATVQNVRTQSRSHPQWVHDLGEESQLAEVRIAAPAEGGGGHINETQSTGLGGAALAPQAAPTVDSDVDESKHQEMTSGGKSHSRIYSVVGKEVEKINVFDPPDYDLINSLVHYHGGQDPHYADQDAAHQKDHVVAEQLYAKDSKLHDSFQFSITHDEKGGKSHSYDSHHQPADYHHGGHPEGYHQPAAYHHPQQPASPTPYVYDSMVTPSEPLYTSYFHMHENDPLPKAEIHRKKKVKKIKKTHHPEPEPEHKHPGPPAAEEYRSPVSEHHHEDKPRLTDQGYDISSHPGQSHSYNNFGERRYSHPLEPSSAPPSHAPPSHRLEKPLFEEVHTEIWPPVHEQPQVGRIQSSTPYSAYGPFQPPEVEVPLTVTTPLNLYPASPEIESPKIGLIEIDENDIHQPGPPSPPQNYLSSPRVPPSSSRKAFNNYITPSSRGPDQYGSDQSCPLKPPIHCDSPSLYRTFDGSCNNLQHPRWGRSFECLDRILPPVYADGRVAPKLSVSRRELPPARVISNAVNTQHAINAPYTHMVMQFGQFLTHDIAWTPLADNLVGLGGISCCPTAGHRECYPIVIPPHDPVYSRIEPNRTCNTFLRSETCESCFNTGYRDQITQQTAFIDGSNIYGTRLNDSWIYRERDGSGTLTISRDVNGKPLLPRSRGEIDTCSQREGTRNCFQSGDQRVNQHPGLTCLATIWMRQHNRLARALKKINPHWDGERLYQEARRIVGAQMQVIAYKEYLPLILGSEIMDRYGLNLMSYHGGYSHYDPKTNPTILTEFATGAFRWGHSTIQGTWAKVDSRGNVDTFPLRDRYFFPIDIIQGRMDSILRGLVYQPSEEFDTFMTDDARNHLYKDRRTPVGPDLAAQNIQRGRDHGIPGYTAYVKQCLGNQVHVGHTWDDLGGLFRPELVPTLRKLYPNIDDMDLWIGGMAEKPVLNSLVGPIFSCIIGNQFNKLKYGDRYFFEHGGQDGSFTPDQLTQLKKTTLAKVLCQNADDFSTIQPNVFLFSGGGRNGLLHSSSADAENRVEDFWRGASNSPVPCHQLPDVDLKAWQESHHHSPYDAAAASYVVQSSGSSPVNAAVAGSSSSSSPPVASSSTPSSGPSPVPAIQPVQTTAQTNTVVTRQEGEQILTYRH